MNYKIKDSIIVMNFSGIYERVQFGDEEISMVDVSSVPGTNCYCDEEAFDAIYHSIEDFSARGIHFIDSGNYHYMSRIWLGKFEEPVTLIVFDNHTDMQPPAFGGILSCGGWIAAVLEELSCVKDVILIGPDEEAFSQVEPALAEKVKFLSREKLSESSQKQREQFLFDVLEKSLDSVYISIDKDILRPGEADTSWSQGDLSLEELLNMLKSILDCVEVTGKELLGVDICGESEGNAGANKEENIKANRAVLNCLKEWSAQ